jgi:hypothetical protein
MALPVQETGERIATCKRKNNVIAAMAAAAYATIDNQSQKF